MAEDARITDLTAVSSPTASDPLAIVNAAQTKQVTLEDLMGAGVAAGVFTSVEANTGNVFCSNAAGPSLLNEAATSNNPTLVPNRADPDTGMGWNTADSLSLIAGDVEGLRLTKSGASDVDAVFDNDVTVTGQLGVGTVAQTNVSIYTSPNGTLGTGSQYGGWFHCIGSSDAVSGITGGYFRASTTAASFTCGATRGVLIGGANLGSGSTITTNYGLVIQNQTAGATNYSIYTEGGLHRFGDDVFLSNAAGPTLLDEAATATNPTLVPNRADPDTGVGWFGYDNLSLIPGGSEIIRVNTSGLYLYGHTFRHGDGSGAPYHNLYGAAGSQKHIGFQSDVTGNARTRWQLVSNNTAESGSDVGSDFEIKRFSDAGGLLGTPLLIYRNTGNIIFEGAIYGSDAAGPGLLNEAASATNPTLIPDKSNPDTGIGTGSTTDRLSMIAGGTQMWEVHTSGMISHGNVYFSNAAGPAIYDEAATSTNPTLLPNKGDNDTGIGWQVNDALSLVAGGVEGLRLEESAGVITYVVPGTFSSDLYATDAAGPGFLNEAATSTNPTLVPNKADPDTGVGWNSTNAMSLVAGGGERFRVENSQTYSYQNLYGGNAAGPGLLNEAATATNPTLVPNRADPDTGMGWQAADALSLVAGGIEGLRLTESASAVAALFSGTLAWGSGGVVSSSDEVLTRDAVVYVVEATVDVAVGDGAAYFTIGDAMAGKDLVDCHARVITAGTTGTTDIQIARYRSSWVDMLTTKITIDSGELGSEDAAAAFSIDTANDDVAEHDLIRIDVDAVSTTAPKGLIVRLTFK